MKKKIIVIVIIGSISLLTLTRGVFMRLNYNRYKGNKLSFEYPKHWTLRESGGSTEKYFQIHIFSQSDIDKDIGFGPSISLTIYPNKAIGGVYATLQEIIQKKLNNAKKLKEYQLVAETTRLLKGDLNCQEVQLSYSLRLPLYKTSANDVLIKEETIFFERNNELFVLSYKNLAGKYHSSKNIFERVIRTLRFLP